MNYKLPPLPEIAHHQWFNQPAYSEADMQAYAIAAIEAQGVPDGGDRVAKELVRIADILRDCGRLVSKSGASESAIRSAAEMLASAPPAPQANKTHVLVPLRMTRAMQDVVNEEDWSRADLLAAAEAVTEDEYAIADETEPVAPQAKQCEWTNCPSRVGDKCCNEQASVVQQEPMLYVFEYELAQFNRVSDWMAATIRKLPGDGRVALYTHPAPQAKPQPLSADRDAQVAELERELEKEKQYVKEMTKDRDHWMTVAAERALLLDKNRKVNKPLSNYEWDEIG